MDRFGIIQLSDLQFGENHRFNNPSEFVSKLQNDIREISDEYKATPLYIILSGDITEKAQQSEFQDAVNVLGKFSDDLNINRMKILSVPGNHDVNWEFVDDSQKVGNDQLKFQPYNSFVSNITNSKDSPEKDCYPRIIEDQLDLGLDSSLDLEFLLLNSCEKEERLHHEGYVCPKKLQKMLQVPKESERLKIAILHHPLYPSTPEKDSAIENASDIESILSCHKYNIVLTGHVHKGSISAKINDSGHQIIIASCGSTGVNKKQREDGIQNQYCIHVIDLNTNKFKSMWRAYNPSIQTKYGLGGWTQDNSFKKNPTEFPLPAIKRIHSISPKEMVEPALSTGYNITDWNNFEFASELTIANLLGGWNEQSASDKEIVERLASEKYTDWISKVREILQWHEGPLSLKNGIWAVVKRQEMWKSLGSRLFDEHLEKFKKCAVNVLKEPDPRFDLPAEDRYTANIHGKVLKYSRALRKGLAESIALLGSQPDALKNCSQNKAETVAVIAIREILSEADWILWASLNYLLPILAEASPEEFLSASENALKITPCPFDEIFSQERAGIFGENYMTGLLWALETLAWDEKYLVRVTVILGNLASHDPGGNWGNRPANSITTIFLPWIPQTIASVDKRKIAIQTLKKEFPAIAWKLLLNLLPNQHQISMGSHKPVWRKIIPEGWEEGVTNEE